MFKRQAGEEHVDIVQAFVPPWDVRMAYAIETHGVEQTMLNPPPGPGGILDQDLNLGALLEKIPAFMPFIFLLGVYLASQVAAWLKVPLFPVGRLQFVLLSVKYMP